MHSTQVLAFDDSAHESPVEVGLTSVRSPAVVCKTQLEALASPARVGEVANLNFSDTVSSDCALHESDAAIPASVEGLEAYKGKYLPANV